MLTRAHWTTLAAPPTSSLQSGHSFWGAMYIQLPSPPCSAILVPLFCKHSRRVHAGGHYYQHVGHVLCSQLHGLCTLYCFSHAPCVCICVCVCVGFCMCDVCVEYASLYLFLPFSSLLTLPPKYSAIQIQFSCGLTSMKVDCILLISH